MLIEREAALKAVHEAIAEGKSWYSALSHLPSAEKTGKWIPCTERLPKEDTDVLICYKYREGEGDTNHARIDITSYGDMYFGGNRISQIKHWREPFEYFALNYEVVAWMPLPQPYKGE